MVLSPNFQMRRVRFRENASLPEVTGCLSWSWDGPRGQSDWIPAQPVPSLWVPVQCSDTSHLLNPMGHLHSLPPPSLLRDCHPVALGKVHLSRAATPRHALRLPYWSSQVDHPLAYPEEAEAGRTSIAKRLLCAGTCTFHLSSSIHTPAP